MKYILCLLLALNLAFAANGPGKIPKDPVKFEAQTFENNGENILALSYLNHPHWHTYWKNPGDAGLETKYKFYVNGSEVQVEEIGWPAPKKFIEQGDILAYGYDDQYSFFFKLTKDQLQKWNGTTFKVFSNWLVCASICIPGQGTVEGKITKGKFKQSTHSDFSVNQKTLLQQFNEIPRKIVFPNDLDIVLTKSSKDNHLTLYYNYSGKGATFDSQKQNLLTPFPLSPFDFTREEVKFDSTGHIYGKFPIAWDGEYSEPPVEFPKDGKFQKPYNFQFLFFNPDDGKTHIIEKTFDHFAIDSKASEAFFSQVKSDKSQNSNSSQTSNQNKPTAQNNLFYYLVMAFLGGLILNVMPCVLPVISLKLFGLIKYQDHSRAQILKHNMFYTLGVILTFMVLALLVLLLKSSGETVGWGFQLQSPHFVAVMAIVLFIFALNMFGLFEFRVPGGERLAAMQGGDGPLGHIFEGILATILSTPCSAPFLGTALTFAFTSGTLGIFGMFFVIGLGLSFPFIFTAFFPGSIKVLPKPGKWMNKLKIFLALTLILTMIWLIDIFNVLVDSSSAFIELLTVIALFFFAVFYSSKYSKNFKQVLTSLILPIIVSIHLLTLPLATTGKVEGNTSLLIDKQAKGIAWERWSEEKMKAYQAQKKKVFIDFTAKWCFTCKVNEKLVIDTKSFKELIESTGTVALLADWTKRDEDIGKWLESQGLVGVPAYFVINSNGELISLGETLTLDEVKKHLE